MIPVLIHLRPFRLSTSERFDIRVADGGSADTYALGQLQWQDAITQRPVVSLEIMSPDLKGAVQASRATVTLNLRTLGLLGERIKWVGAKATIYTSPALSWPAQEEFEGIVVSQAVEVESGTVSLTLEIETDFLTGPLLINVFDGGGGLGGEAEVRGKLMPVGFGPVESIEPVWFDTTRWIGMLDGYGNTQSIDRLMEGLADRGPSVGDFTSYTELASAIDDKVVLPGQWATSIADGLVGLGAPPAAPITVNAQFRSNRIGEIMRRILAEHRLVPPANIDAVAFSAMDAAAPYDAFFWTADQRDCKDLLEALAGSINATPLVALNNTVTITRAVASAPVATLDRSGAIEPRVMTSRAGEVIKPVYKIKARTARPARVLDYQDVLFDDAIEDKGLYQEDEVYRAGHLVWSEDKSSWLYINDLPSSGNAPPVWPATENDYWRNMTPPATGTGATYADGTPIDDLRPAEPGATAGATQSQLDEIANAIALAESKGQLFFRITAPSAEESSPGDTWIDGNGVFWDRVTPSAPLLGGHTLVLGGFILTIEGATVWQQAEVQPLVGAITVSSDAFALAAAAAADANIAIDGFIGLADDGNLSAHEKITVLIPGNDKLNMKWFTLFALATSLSVSTAAASAARSDWTNYLASLSPAWNDINFDTPVDRGEFNGFRDMFDQQLYWLDQAIQNVQTAQTLAALDAANAAAQLANDAQATADGKVQSFFQSAPPTAEGVGDLWFDTSDGNKQHRWSGTAWVEVQDASIGDALVAAAGAQATADGKVATFYAATAPTAEGVGDLWYDTTTGVLKRWNGANWVTIASVNNARGDYAAAATYNVGDIVLWTSATGGDGSGYIRIGTGPTTGTAPSNGTYWSRFVQSGTSTNVIWRKSNTIPATPAASAGVPAGWYQTSQALPAGPEPIWISYGIKTGTTFAWQTPVVAAAADIRLWEAIDEDGNVKDDKVGTSSIKSGALSTTQHNTASGASTPFTVIRELSSIAVPVLPSSGISFARVLTYASVEQNGLATVPCKPMIRIYRILQTNVAAYLASNPEPRLRNPSAFGAKVNRDHAQTGPIGVPYSVSMHYTVETPAEGDLYVLAIDVETYPASTSVNVYNWQAEISLDVMKR